MLRVLGEKAWGQCSHITAAHCVTAKTKLYVGSVGWLLKALLLQPFSRLFNIVTSGTCLHTECRLLNLCILLPNTWYFLLSKVIYFKTPATKMMSILHLPALIYFYTTELAYIYFYIKCTEQYTSIQVRHLILINNPFLGVVGPK